MSAYPSCRCEAPIPRVDLTTTSGHYCDICGGPIPHASPTFTLPQEAVTTLAPMPTEGHAAPDDEREAT